jgi:hypothetical protein
MGSQYSETEYRLKLRDGDVINATVTSVGMGEVGIDTSLADSI